MKIPDYSCKIEAYCSLNPSEDPQKVATAIRNILPRCEIKIGNFSVSGLTNLLNSLEKINETIHSRRSQNSLKRNMENNLDNNTTWFYLNKQAAFADTVALCEEAEESPLGPIKLIITSRDIEQIISWITS